MDYKELEQEVACVLPMGLFLFYYLYIMKVPCPSQ